MSPGEQQKHKHKAKAKHRGHGVNPEGTEKLRRRRTPLSAAKIRAMSLRLSWRLSGLALAPQARVAASA
jgi:hypothetical protein